MHTKYSVKQNSSQPHLEMISQYNKKTERQRKKKKTDKLHQCSKVALGISGLLDAALSLYLPCVCVRHHSALSRLTQTVHHRTLITSDESLTIGPIERLE